MPLRATESQSQATLVSPLSLLSAFLSRETSVRDFPHSRQTRLARGVIRPQDGQTLCDRTSWTCGLNVANNVRRNCHVDARRRRRDGRYGSINFTFVGFFAACADPGDLTMAGTKHAILYRIAQIALILQSTLIASRSVPFQN